MLTQHQHSPRPTLATSDADTAVELGFAADADYCRYNRTVFLAGFDDSDRAMLERVLPPAEPAPEVDLESLDLYLAAEALEEDGHPELAEAVTQHLHSENLYGCLCRNQAIENFKQAVDELFAAADALAPHGAWYAASRLYSYGLQADTLLEDVDWDDRDDDGDITVTLDASGHGTVVTDKRTETITAIRDIESAMFAQGVDSGDIVTSSGDYFGPDDWLALPADVRTAMAVLRFHDLELGDVQFSDQRGRTMDLDADALEALARGFVELPAAVQSSCRALLPTTGTLADLIAAVQAAS